MSGDGELRWSTDMLRANADSVERASAEMDQAGAAARTVTMDSQAYGQLCQFLPGMLNIVFDLAVDAVRDSAESLRSAATTLNGVATAAGARSSDSAKRLRDSAALRGSAG